jgi:uncharacterized membrane protein
MSESAQRGAYLDGSRGRRAYLDWMRGLAVLVMIEAHVIDSWTRADARHTWQFMWAMILGGFGAPLFLFLAGLSVALSAGSKARRSGDARAAATVVMTRGAWIFGLAFVFRIQSWILGLGSPHALLKVDILNILGPGIVAAAAIWSVFRSSRSRVIAYAALTLAVAAVSPSVRHSPLLDAVPAAAAAYLRPVPGGSNFCMFPWIAFVFGGAVIGVLLDGAQTREDEAKVNTGLFAWGALLAAAAYGASWLPSPYAQSEFWGGSPAFFFLRTGIMTLTIAVAYAWERLSAMRPRTEAGVGLVSWSPMQQLGRNSLFIYWIHVEMVYGLVSLRIHKRLSHPEAWIALAAFICFMFACAIARDRFVAWRGSRNAERPPGAPAYA